MIPLDGLLDPEAATTVTTALAPFLVPTGPDDQRHTTQRRADGLIELARWRRTHPTPTLGGNNRTWKSSSP